LILVVKAYEYIIINFACLSFKQHVFSSLRDDKKTHFVRFLSESWKEHKRYFQPVYGEINNDIFVCLGYVLKPKITIKKLFKSRIERVVERECAGDIE